MQVVFLGTSGSMPTAKRGLPSVVLNYDAEMLMFDCGEGTQRQVSSAKLSLSRKMKIFISHMHGDHVLGLPGTIQSMALLGRTKKLDVFGPPGIHDFLRCVHDTVKFGPAFPLEIHEIHWGKIVDESSYEIHAVRADHVIPCLSYAFVEKPRPGRFNVAAAKRLRIPEGPLWKKLQFGRSVRVGRRKISSRGIVGPPRRGLKVTYATDTRPSMRVAFLAKGSDLLIHDACFDESLKEKAKLDGHSTAIQAARIARRAKARMLALTHISARYRDPKVLFREAGTIFKNSFVAEDLMTVEL